MTETETVDSSSKSSSKSEDDSEYQNDDHPSAQEVEHNSDDDLFANFRSNQLAVSLSALFSS